MTRLDGAEVFVIGGGPAGLATAIAARQKGLHAMVADGSEPPIDKACGEGLMPETQAALRDLGVSAEDLGGVALRGIRFIQNQNEVAALFPAGSTIGIRRTVLHEVLAKRAQDCGVQFLWNTPVSGIVPGGVQTSRGLIEAKWIVGADGSGSRVRRWSGLDLDRARSLRHATRRHYQLTPWSEFVEIYWGEHCQAYVTPVSREEICVVVLAGSAGETDFDVAMRNWPQLKQRLGGSALTSRERGAVTLMHRLRHVVKGNVALVGDSSGGVDAITGEGLRLCFRQALALADALAASDLGQYERAHKKLAKRPTRIAELILLLSRNDMLRERFIRSVAARPKVFGKLLAIHAGQSSPVDVVSAGLMLGWQLLAA